MSGFVCSHCHLETDIFSKGGGREQAKKFEVPFLGEIPLDPQVVTSGDSGHPVVVAHPQSLVTTAFREMARLLAGQVSITNFKTDKLEIVEEVV